MSDDIVIIRDGHDYRLMHGHLRLANILRGLSEVDLEIKGEGKLRIMKTRDGYLVRKDGYHLPLSRH